MGISWPNPLTIADELKRKHSHFGFFVDQQGIQLHRDNMLAVFKIYKNWNQ
jgi:hypothetical protein